MKKQINLGIFLVCPIVFTTLSCSVPWPEKIDTTFGEKQAKEMIMIQNLNYDKIVNQNLKGEVENLTPEKIVEQIKKEEIIIDFYNRSNPESEDPLLTFPIRIDHNSPEDKYNEITIANQIAIIKLATHYNNAYSLEKNIAPKNSLPIGLTWVNVGIKATKWSADTYVWAIQMIKEVKLVAKHKE